MELGTGLGMTNTSRSESFPHIVWDRLRDDEYFTQDDRNIFRNSRRLKFLDIGH